MRREINTKGRGRKSRKKIGRLRDELLRHYLPSWFRTITPTKKEIRTQLSWLGHNLIKIQAATGVPFSMRGHASPPVK